MKTAYILLSSLIVAIAFSAGITFLLYLTSTVTSYKHNIVQKDCSGLWVTNNVTNRQDDIESKTPDVAGLE